MCHSLHERAALAARKTTNCIQSAVLDVQDVKLRGAGYLCDLISPKELTRWSVRTDKLELGKPVIWLTLYGSRCFGFVAGEEYNKLDIRVRKASVIV